MASAFEAFRRLGPAAFVLEAIAVAIAADLLLMAFMLLRRTYRKRHFARRDARVAHFRENWDALISGKISFDTWRGTPADQKIVETIVLDAFEAAPPPESARLLKFLRDSGLLEKSILEARRHRGWRRHRALVALGRTRAPEGIPSLGEGLRDEDLETRLAALRGLGRMACPEAAEAILSWVGEAGLTVPALPLQSALLQTAAERPRLLLTHVQQAKGRVREVLGLVLGQLATPSLGADLLPFVHDELDELRAAAARGLSQVEPRIAIEVLIELARDPVWFVRLRAVVSLGKLRHAGAIPALLRALSDSHRLVRLRSAEALVELKAEMVRVFDGVQATGDRYGLHAYLTALDNAGFQTALKAELDASRDISAKRREVLLTALRSAMAPNAPETSKTAAVQTASSS